MGNNSVSFHDENSKFYNQKSLFYFFVIEEVVKHKMN